MFLIIQWLLSILVLTTSFKLVRQLQLTWTSLAVRMVIDMGDQLTKPLCLRCGTLAGICCFRWFYCYGGRYTAGMVLHWQYSVATVLFKDKFTQEERDSGLTNIAMGLPSSQRVPFHSVQLTRSCHPKLHRRFSIDRCSCWSCRLETHGSSRSEIFVIAL